MEFSISEEQKALCQAIREFAEGELCAGALERDRAQSFAHDLWLRCGEHGLQGLPVPQSYGGRGLDSLSTALALEAFGRGCGDGGLIISVCAHLLGCVVPVWKFGAEEQKKRYLPGLCSGSLIGALAITEPESGSDAFSMRTTADRDGDDYRINGRKAFVTNGPVADVILVCALTDVEKGWRGGISCFLVEKDTPGLRLDARPEKMGLRSSPLGTLSFEDVRVPANAAVARIGGGVTVFKQAMLWERTGVSACHVGIMERLLQESIDRARGRTQFGEPIGAFQSISYRIADMKARLEASRLLTYKAAWALEHSRTSMLDVSLAKVSSSESFVQTALETMQIHGGDGYMTNNQVERVMRDAVASTIYSGTSEMQRNTIARWLGL